MTSRRRLLQHTLASAVGMAGLPSPGVANVVSSTPARAALVIGNERYRQNPLKSAANDARAVARLLTEAGFAVDLKLNATLEQMVGGIDALGKAFASRDVGTVLFYYAGHAAQLDWRNYLLPVDGEVASALDVRKQCVDLSLLLGRLARSKDKTALIILDACRDDPFGPRFRPPLKGMSQYDAPAGTLLAFATAPGRVAVELPGSANGLYTEHLVRELSAKGVRIEDALKRVRLNVRFASRGAQIPWESTSLESDVYLFPAPRLSEAELERQFQEEYEAWGRVKASRRPEEWVNYLRRFPNGKFAEVAQVRMRQLLAAAEQAPSAKPAVRAPALQLGNGLPVPPRFKGSGNPNSAGTYPFRPVWTPGDEYFFHVLDLYSNVVQSRYRLVIKRVDLAQNRVEVADGSLMDLMGGTLKEGRTRSYETPIQVNPAELQVGRKWATRFQQRGDFEGEGEYNFRVTGREKVTVPAGEFSAFRVEGTGWFMGPRSRNSRMHMVRWMVPGLNFAVRLELHQFTTARVLVSARQAVSS